MLAITGVLLVAAILFCYAHPLADDFARAYKGRDQGVVPSTVHEYLTWSGRWASASVNYFLTSSFDIVRLYPVLLGITASLLATSTYVLLLESGIGEGLSQRLALTMAALALYWVGMPHPGETVYWLTGGTDNLAGLALSLLLLAGLLRNWPVRTCMSGLVGAALSLLAVITTGFHELFGLLLCIVLAGGTLKMWLACDSRRRLWTICLLAALAGFIVVYVAPGNAARRAEFPLAADVGVTCRLAVKQGISNLIPWVLDLRLLSGTALLFLLAPSCLKRAGKSRDGTARDLVIVGVTWILAVGGGFVGASWATGSNLVLRTLDGIYLVFLAGWFWVAVMLARHFTEGQELFFTTAAMRRVLVVTFAAAMLLTGNTWKALPDLRRSAPAYSKAMHSRWLSLQTARDRDEGDVVVKPLPSRPQAYINYFELREDPNHWENTSVAKYFGLNTVRLASNIVENR